MSRRGSVAPGGNKSKAGTDAGKRRTSNRDTKGDLPAIKEGDIFYRVVKYYPSIPEIPEEISLTVTKPIDPSRETGSTTSKQDRRSATDRRGSTLPGPASVREGANTPGIEELTASHGHARDRLETYIRKKL